MDSLSTLDATTADDDPMCGGLTATVWYRFTPTRTGIYVAITQGSSYEAQVSVLTGTRGALTPVEFRLH